VQVVIIQCLSKEQELRYNVVKWKSATLRWVRAYFTYRRIIITGIGFRYEENNSYSFQPIVFVTCPLFYLLVLPLLGSASSYAILILGLDIDRGSAILRKKHLLS